MGSAGITGIKVFYAYAQADERLQVELAKHLSRLTREGLVSEWHYGKILPGTERQQAIDEQISIASIILLLITPDFLASDYHYEIELEHALARHEAGEARVIPILLRPVDWEGARFAKLQYLPRNGKPVTRWKNRDEAFREIAKGIREAIEDLRASAGLLHRPSSPSVTLEPTARKAAQMFMAADLPIEFVPRPEEFKALKDSILYGERARPTAITAALEGAGGYGKTTLALALCHDPDIRASFPDGIIWITLGEKQQPLIGKIEDLLYLLSGERPNFTSLEAATTRLKAMLTDRSMLLVIDDVWRESDLTPFLQERSSCAWLVTTRLDSVLPSNAFRIPVDAMRWNEAVQLLRKGLESQPDIEDLEPTFQKLASRLGEWPLLLTLTNGVLRERVTRFGEPLSTALTYIQRTLDKRGVVAFDAKNVEERREAVARTLEVSIAHLDADDQARFEELAIFPEATVIPLTTVQRLWHATGGLDDLDTEALCQRLSGLSLLLSYDLKTHYIRLHDVVRNYLQAKVKPRLPTLHGQFLDAYSLSFWALLPPSEPYLWDHLATHLLAAGRIDILITTVKDLRYLAMKTLVSGTSAMEQDLALATQQAPEDIKLVHRGVNSSMIKSASRGSIG